jgi:hypothetical protein
VFRSDIREELLKVASKGGTVTYGYLMKKYRVSRGHPRGAGIAGVIGEIDRFEYQRGAPGFAAIAVRKDTGYPGGGYFCDGALPRALRKPKSQSTDPKLSSAQKEHIRKQQKAIWAYYRLRANGN